MSELKTLTTLELSAWAQQAKAKASQGRVADRIPLLAAADYKFFAVHICRKAGRTFSFGDTACMFPLMSAVKPFLLLYLLEYLGAKSVFQWVGVEPSSTSFNSLEQLIADRGRPRNPMINSGAITLADKLPGYNARDRTQHLCTWLNQTAGCKLFLDEQMLASVRSATSQANLAIAEHLVYAGYVKNQETAIDTYEHICCLSGQVEDLALLGKLLACENGLITRQNRCSVNALMLTCGLYQASCELALRIGLPMKSGISGTLLAIVPGQGAIACYSPPLDSIGNSVAALGFIESLSQGLGLSIFADK
ncbi:glutaminase [Aetokthonos hydrillicola Thurmond2011]|jgi:glutaminase|uniref:Glutaminase n=1 Tax=Aetokthonos hydrillicola Thurmond2011 TaxID=2712845 RepID=A0AAP5MED4_9CYAN|nr:glutaminase [Aetokthonos hydrillicola]MBO3461031.1 glutaminase A [Aetokthonos hydrillicola CCALA 1050]MBW4588400.1 glutaminase [Aetokthonos hydrillicola CCALA 1050]MDR9900769.1 glutaminase [Aetokthonos hydrillicola Thurmond2011]